MNTPFPDLSDGLHGIARQGRAPDLNHGAQAGSAPLQVDPAIKF